jgi:hypothetical protein
MTSALALAVAFAPDPFRYAKRVGAGTDRRFRLLSFPAVARMPSAPRWTPPTDAERAAILDRVYGLIAEAALLCTQEDLAAEAAAGTAPAPALTLLEGGCPDGPQRRRTSRAPRRTG